MSIGCGEGREMIRGDFSLVYLLGTNKDGLTFPDEEKDIVPPNSAVCSYHLGQVPETAFKKSSEGIEGFVYGVANGSGNEIYGGLAISLQGLKSGDTFKYLTQESMKEYLPKALEIIDHS